MSRMAGDDEALQPQLLAHRHDQAADARAQVGGVVLRDHAAEGEAGERLGGHQGRLQVGAADVVEIDVDAVRRGASSRRR